MTVQQSIRRAFAGEHVIRNQACREYVDTRMQQEGEALARELLAAYPDMGSEFVQEHLRLRLEHDFWSAINTAERLGALRRLSERPSPLTWLMLLLFFALITALALHV